MRKPKTTTQFIAEAQAIHGDRYGYSQAEYIRSTAPLRILCHDHGPFQQSPGNHLSGHGCPRCAGVAPLTLPGWLALARSIHGDRYDYSSVRIRGAVQKVEIICREHGSFWQIPGHHTRLKNGCPQCSRKNPEKTKTQRQSSFIQRARIIHGTRYDYSKVEYRNNKSNVEIICALHGSFWQRPSNHINKHLRSGCPQCALERHRRNLTFGSDEDIAQRLYGVHTV